MGIWNTLLLIKLDKKLLKYHYFPESFMTSRNFNILNFCDEMSSFAVKEYNFKKCDVSADGILMNKLLHVDS